MHKQSVGIGWVIVLMMEIEQELSSPTRAAEESLVHVSIISTICLNTTNNLDSQWTSGTL
jgi:hypothetical protein